MSVPNIMHCVTIQCAEYRDPNINLVTDKDNAMTKSQTKKRRNSGPGPDIQD